MNISENKNDTNGIIYTEDDEKYLIKAAERVFAALDYFLYAEDEISVNELQKKMKLNNNMAFRILYTLERTGYISKNPRTGNFSLTLKSLTLGRQALHTIEVRKCAMPHLLMLSERVINANVVLSIMENDDIIIAAYIGSTRIPRMYVHVGKLQVMHATVAGKILASELPREEVLKILEKKGMQKITEQTITNIDDFFNELESVRKNQIAWERSEHNVGMNSVGAPVRGANGKIIAAVCISGFDIYISEQKLQDAIIYLKETAYGISHSMGYFA